MNGWKSSRKTQSRLLLPIHQSTKTINQCSVSTVLVSDNLKRKNSCLHQVSNPGLQLYKLAFYQLSNQDVLLGLLSSTCGIKSRLCFPIFFLSPITDYCAYTYKKHMNNSCLRNITPAIFHTYILGQQPNPQKVTQYLYFILFRCTVYPNQPNYPH